MIWAHLFGLDNASGAAYLFWSGFGALVIPPLTSSLPIVLVLLRKHNCHQHRCPWVGRYPERDGWHYCRKHHRNDGKQHPEYRVNHGQ